MAHKSPPVPEAKAKRINHYLTLASEAEQKAAAHADRANKMAADLIDAGFAMESVARCLGVSSNAARYRVMRGRELQQGDGAERRGMYVRAGSGKK